MNSCGCGCNSNISYGYNKSCTKGYAGIYFCKDPLSYVKTTFVMPADNVILEIEVTDSSKLYVGQGLRIGTGFVQVVAIEDTNNISIAQNGTATAGLTITAIHPTYGCYQYPMLAAGEVDLLIDPDVAGLDSAFAVVASSVVTPTKQLTYGFVGPYKVQLEFEMSFTVANTPRYIEVELPVGVESGAPQATFVAMIDNGAGFTPAIAYRRNDTIVTAIDAATDLANGASIVRVSGFYELQ